MSAAPKLEAVESSTSATEPAAIGNDGEGFALLEALRRKLDDQASQGRKTQQQVTQLAESIGALVEVQRRRTRSLNLNSFVAYLIFTLLCGTGSVLLYRSRASELGEARDRAERERDLATKRADETAATLAARDKAAADAWTVYELLEAGKRPEAMTKLGSLETAPMTKTERAVLAARAHATAVQATDAALAQAATAVKAGRHADAITPLEAALAADPKGPRSLAVHYYLGVAYAKTGKLPAAIVHLTAAVDDPEKPDARFHLASALDRSGELAKARTEYDRFATAQPQSQLAAYAMRRSATLARMPAKSAPQAVPVPKGKKKKPAAAPVEEPTDAPAPAEPAPADPAP